MAKRRTSRTSKFGGAAHTATLGVGRCIKTAKGPCGARVPLVAVDRQARALATAIGGTTSIQGRGRYKHEDGTWADEPSVLIQALTNGGQSCARFTRAVHSVAARAARDLRQESILAVVQCAGHAVDGAYVDKTGKASDLYPMPSPAQRKALGGLLCRRR